MIYQVANTLLTKIKKSVNYSMTSEGLWNYYRDEINDDANQNDAANNERKNNNKITTSKSFEHKTNNRRNTTWQ